jgi:hypothetical protein
LQNKALVAAPAKRRRADLVPFFRVKVAEENALFENCQRVHVDTSTHVAAGRGGENYR